MSINITVVGLGYVGLPLACRLASAGFNVRGYDINSSYLTDLKNKIDSQKILHSNEFEQLCNIEFVDTLLTTEPGHIFIITVPTPVLDDKYPDFKALKVASRSIAKVMSRNDIVVYESTVYPGATEEVCIPILEDVSKLRLNMDFSVGYSPERVNPGDKEHRIDNIVKVVSASNKNTLNILSEMYSKLTTAGIHKAQSIRVAEASKIIENVQRDVNIALMNEFEMYLNRKEISISEVLAAANTKWNFVPFYNGLVGGHCIGVDPFYCIYDAKRLGFHPEVMISSRNRNDKYVDEMFLRFMIFANKQKILLNDAKILFYGATFKPNCGDTRNSLNMIFATKLESLGATVEICDPYLDFAPNHSIQYDILVIGAKHYTLDNDLMKYKYNKVYQIIPE